jgi:hypothetical protein
MNYDLSAALNALRQGAAFQIANDATPGSAYMFNSLLPEQPRYDYQARTGSMTVRATMAGLVGMDSPYPEGGSIEITTFSEETAKIANRVRLPEKAMRDLHEFLRRLTDQTPTSITKAIQTEALNFVDKMIVQPHLDTFEYLRGQALVAGQIDWTFGKVRLQVNYGVPSDNFLPHRSGTAGYGGSASVFWDDIRRLRRLLKNDVRAFIMHSETKEMILANSVNNITLMGEDLQAGTFEIVRRIPALAGSTSTVMNSTDPRDRGRFITYDLEGEVWDLANPGRTKRIPFMPRGAILAVGNYNARTYQVGQGATSAVAYSLGYTHIAPTVEGGGRPGRWSDVYTPENEPWAMEGRGVTNGLPVIEAPERIAVATTDLV